MKKIIALTVFSIVLSFSNVSFAEGLVIISSTDNIEELDINDVARIFLGKVTRFPSGEEVLPLDMHPSDPSYEEFARVVLNKTPSQLRAYWARQVFTGKGRPPTIIGSTDELQQLVASDKRYLSYVDRNEIEFEVRWVIELETSVN